MHDVLWNRLIMEYEHDICAWVITHSHWHGNGIDRVSDTDPTVTVQIYMSSYCRNMCIHVLMTTRVEELHKSLTWLNSCDWINLFFISNCHIHGHVLHNHSHLSVKQPFVSEMHVIVLNTCYLEQCTNRKHCKQKYKSLAWFEHRTLQFPLQCQTRILMSWIWTGWWSPKSAQSKK
jgi:hypothetical protein